MKKEKREKPKLAEFNHQQKLTIAISIGENLKKNMSLQRALEESREDLTKDGIFPKFDGYQAAVFYLDAKHDKNSELSKDFYSQKPPTKKRSYEVRSKFWITECEEMDDD